MTYLRLQANAELVRRARQQQRETDPEYAKQQRTFSNTYWNDPAAFISDCFMWKSGSGPTFYQLEIASELVQYNRLSVRGPHGLGKTAIVGWLVHWFALTRDNEADWKIPITASAWRQLSKFAMPEVHKWAHRLNWAKIGREPYNLRSELLTLSLKLNTGEAFAMASDNSALIEGAHADELLYIFDESKEIPAGTWDSAEGAASTGKTMWLSVSTPGEPSGRFYDIQAKKPGYEDWHVHAVRLEDAIRAGRIKPDWAEARRKQWGEKAAVYINRVLGDFASSEADGVIPLSWVEKSNERWHEWQSIKDELELEFKTVGVDVARSGEDKTVLALRYGNVISELRRYSYEDTMATTGRIRGILNKYKDGRAIVDVIGIGAGVVDRLREMKFNVVAFNASAKTDFLDASGEVGFTNCRSAAWWHMRELLDPDNEHNVALPPDDLLTGDLTAPHYRVVSGGKIQVENKEDIKDRIGRSTDDGDAVVQAFWGDQVFSANQWTEALNRKAQKEKEEEEQSWDY